MKCLRCLLYALNLLFWVSETTRSGAGRAGLPLPPEQVAAWRCVWRGARPAPAPLTAGRLGLGEGVEVARLGARGLHPMPGSFPKGILITE